MALEYDFQKIKISRRCNGYYLRWYYNGWHYWLFKSGTILFETEGEKYRTLGRQKVRLGSTQITEQQANAIRTIMNTLEVYVYTDNGWGAVKVEPGSLEVYNNTTHWYDIELVVVIGSKAVSSTGFSPAIQVPTVLPSIEYCELDIAIASQIWMCKNWDAAIPGSVVYDDDEANRAIYGGLYTYNQAMTPGFCPDGYKVPSLDEWRTLITAMGGTLVGGGELKEVGTDHWLTPNTGAVDTYSFAALGGGDKNRWTGVYENLKERGFFWTSTPIDGSNAYAVYMTYDSASIFELPIIKDYHLSVRLMKSVYSPPPYVPVIYGLLYNWYAATDARDITSSDDWCVPDHLEFKTLFDYLGGDDIAGGKLKEIGFIYWDSLNTGATNEVGFNARGAGMRYIYEDMAVFDGIKQFLVYWNSTDIPEGGRVCIIYYDIDVIAAYEGVSNYSEHKASGASIRLFRSATAAEQLLPDGTACAPYQGNDLKLYRTVKIGTQVWLADNLAETKFRNGDPIPEVTDNVAWAALVTGALCAYNNDWSNV